MKIRNYEKRQFLFTIGIGLLLIEGIFILFLTRKREFCYYKFSGILVNDNLVLFIVNKKEKKLFYQNKYLFYKSKKLTYQIAEDKGMILKKDKQRYDELLIKIKTPKEKKANDLVEFSIKEKKKRILEQLKNAWGR